eukprot:gene11865-13099_t
MAISGDEILDWNEISLVDCTDEEVQDIIAMDDSYDLHLVVCREKFGVFRFPYVYQSILLGVILTKLMSHCSIEA